MAGETGGEYLFAPSLYELQNIFLKFSLEVKGFEIDHEFTGTVFEGETVTAGTFEIEPDTPFTRVTLNWPGSDLDLVLLRPDGSMVDLAYDPDALSYSGSAAKPEWVILQEPQAGTWTVQVFGKEITSPDEPYIVWVSSYSPPTPPSVDTTPPDIQIDVPQEDSAVQDGLTLMATASDLSGVANVYFYIREPNGTQGTPIGYEGLVGSIASGDPTAGEWEYAFDTTELPDGYYVILAKAVDIYDNEGWSDVVSFSIRNWAVLELLPASQNNKGGRTMPVKFSLRIAAGVDPEQPFVYNEELEINVYNAADPGNILQTSVYGDTARDYRIDTRGELYITNFKTGKEPAEYVVEIWRISKDFLVGSLIFETVK
jgi:hypothetical protein